MFKEVGLRIVNQTIQIALKQKLISTDQKCGGKIPLFSRDLISVYTLGSLAHGGFSVEVSDIDVGFVLANHVPLGNETK